MMHHNIVEMSKIYSFFYILYLVFNIFLFLELHVREYLFVIHVILSYTCMFSSSVCRGLLNMQCI